MSQYVTLGNRIQRGQGLATLPDLAGRVALVTGATDGVGRALADQLAGASATTVLAARDAAKGERVRREIVAATGNDEVHVVALDLASTPSTVIIVASEAHRRAKGGLDFDDLMTTDPSKLKLAYGRSKLANILYTRHLASSGLTANPRIPVASTRP